MLEYSSAGGCGGEGRRVGEMVGVEDEVVL